MKHLDIYTRTALRIILLFGMAIAMTYVSEWLRHTNFFGDRPQNPDRGVFVHDGFDWGARHYWYNWLCAFLFLLGVVRTIVITVEDVEHAQKPKP